MTTPAMKEFAPWGYKPTAPFYLVSSAHGARIYIDRPFEDFREVLDIFVRQCLMPDSAGGINSIIMDTDGVVVIGWQVMDQGLVWLGLEWGWDKVTTRRYPFLRPMMIEEAKLSVLGLLSQGAP